MKRPLQTVLSAAQRKPLAACIVSLFALAAPEAFAANTWQVTNCADSGPGSLRAVVASPSTLSGDTIDLSGLNSSNCPGSTISLTTGAIVIPQQTLTVQASQSRITITGYYNGAYQNDRLLNHTGANGALYLTNLNFWYSRFSPATGNAYGGCIRSSGSVHLNNSSVFQCHLTGTSLRTEGGGIWAQNDVSLKYGQVTGNSVVDTHSAPSAGGIKANGMFTAKYSTVSGNSAQFGNVGGVYAGSGGASLTGSTISGNSAGFAGGMEVAGTQPVSITNSTISDNSSTGYVGGIASFANSTTIRNSTIAFNTAVNASPSASPGVYIWNGSGTPSSASIDIESSILSNNTYGTTENDFGAKASNVSTTFNITSNNNIIRAAPGTFRPTTVTTACPLLGPLRSNGGATQTRALLSHSPAIDAGNNNANLNEDQRGRPFVDVSPYPYARNSGIAPDMGAYEVQQNDIVFNASFEDCPAVF